MLKCEIRADNTLHIEGYVNAVERDSKPVMVPSLGRCVEQVRAGVFGAALAENPDVELLENHDHSRKLGSTSDGVLTLSEDSIGLRASADISDPDMITKARTGQLKGWSFGFVATSSEVENRANGIPRRTVTGMKLSEVSLIDGRYTPCYAGTLVEVRAVDDSAEMVEFRADEDIEIIDSSLGDEELRYNPYHDPSNGRFCSGGGSGGGGVLVVEKGQKGKGVYVVENSKFDNFENKEAENISAAESEEFKKNSASLRKSSVKLPEHYAESLKAGDLTHEEYNELMTDLPKNVTENQKFIAKDRFGSHVIAGTTFEQGGEKFGVFSTGKDNEFVVDFNNGKTLPIKSTDLDGNTLFSYSSKVSQTAKSLKNIRRINSRRAFDPIESNPEEQRSLSDEVVEEMDNHNKKEEPVPDYSYYERAMQLLELRYNPYHDPSNGRFCSGGGSGGGGVLFVGKGQKGKGVYVVDVDHDDEYEKWKADKAGGGISAADKAIREATGGVVLKDEYTVVDAVATKKNKKASTTYDKTVLNADVDSNGNVMLKYASGEYSGNYGDEVQNVKYKIKAGFIDNTPVNLDLTKASSISGNTYGIKDAAKSAGMTWNQETNSWVKKDHIINTNTKFTASELASKSDSEIDKIYKAGFYKTGIKKGYSLGQLDDKAKTLKKKSREEQIATIEKFNSLK